MRTAAERFHIVRSFIVATIKSMYARLLTAGATAGTKNEPMLLSTPIARAPTDTKRRNGNIILVRDIASALSSAANPGAIMPTSTGAKIIPTVTTKAPPSMRTERACFARFSAESLPLLSSVLEKTGTKDAESAPSARS